VMPAKAEDLWSQLIGEVRENVPLSEALEPLQPGRELGEPTPLFDKVSEEEIKRLTDMVSRRIEEARG